MKPTKEHNVRTLLEDLDAGVFEQRAAGLGAEKAERMDEGWSERALEWLRVYAATAQLPTGELESFTIEQARAWIGEHAALPEGVDARAWGAVTRRAVRLGYIEATGGYAPAARSHGSPKRLYRRGSRA